MDRTKREVITAKATDENITRAELVVSIPVSGPMIIAECQKASIVTLSLAPVNLFIIVFKWLLFYIVPSRVHLIFGIFCAFGILN